MSISYVKDRTIMAFISHASVFLNYNDEIIITDPWYISSAFQSWWPSPPCAYNIDMILGLIQSGKASIIISHAHPDHIDKDFIKLLPKNTKIYIPKYKDSHFADLLNSLGMNNVIEIGLKELNIGSFKLNSYAHYDSDYDAAISIETPDMFVLHGNDSWVLKKEASLKLKNIIENNNKFSLLMGQGSSASGYPLTYYKLKDSEMNTLLENKNIKMIRSLSQIASDCGFDKILAYACFASINIVKKNYRNRAPISTADYCNKVSNSSKFIDLSPGDIFISDKKGGIVVPLTRSLHLNQNIFYKSNNVYKWPDELEFNVEECLEKAEKFCSDFDDYLINKQKVDNLNKEEIGIEFKFEILDENENIIKIINYKYFNNIANRTKICRVRASILNEVLIGKVPFEDLSIGYLAEWDRKPLSRYNRLFMTYLKSFWYDHY
ncbi:MAG: hypothetical protein CMJ14_07755 [Pelagibacterales bacterium]|nr:hypothetical protein [Pelagibacterales bacterium]|tara:strand:- start:780 stop:2084 length:1305 start_codon:yes stop_codon:yes gene_type:complete